MKISRVYSNLKPWIWSEEDYIKKSSGIMSDLNDALDNARDDVLRRAPRNLQSYKQLEDALNQVLSNETFLKYLEEKMGASVTGKYLGQDISATDADSAGQAVLEAHDDLETAINNLDVDTATAEQVELSKGKMSVALGEAFERTLAFYAASLESEMTEANVDKLVEEFMSGANDRTTLRVSMDRTKTYAQKKGEAEPRKIIQQVEKRTSSLQKTDISIQFKEDVLSRFNLSAKNYKNLNSIKIVDQSPLLNMIDMWNHHGAIYKYLHSGRFGENKNYHTIALKIMGIQALAGGIKKEGEGKLVNALAVRINDPKRPIRIIPIESIMESIGADELPISTHFNGIDVDRDLTEEEFTQYLQKTKVTMHLKNLANSIPRR